MDNNTKTLDVSYVLRSIDNDTKNMNNGKYDYKTLSDLNRDWKTIKTLWEKESEIYDSIVSYLVSLDSDLSSADSYLTKSSELLKINYIVNKGNSPLQEPLDNINRDVGRIREYISTVNSFVSDASLKCKTVVDKINEFNKDAEAKLRSGRGR